MLVVSVGTGTTPIADDALRVSDMHLLYSASHIPSAFMNAAQDEQDLLCRVLGKCLAGDLLDLEVGDMSGVAGLVPEKRFTHVRYNTELTKPARADPAQPISILGGINSTVPRGCLETQFGAFCLSCLVFGSKSRNRAA
jgi:hypothetical protein